MPINRSRFFANIRNGPFPKKLTQQQVDGVTAILNEWERRKLQDLRHLAYMLATAKWETAHTMQPIREMGGDRYLRSKRYWPWFGRGYVQLTWEFNYRAFQKEVLDLFGVDIIANPNNALRHDVAAYIMFEGMYRGTFTKKKLDDYFTSTKSDWVNARRIINGLDRAEAIASIAKEFYADLIDASQTTGAVA